jgi:protein O-GlcNAc transferase
MWKDVGITFLISQITLLIPTEVVGDWSPKILDLPESHVTRYLNTFKDEAENCRNSKSCVYQNILETGLCWGYEKNCPEHLGYSSAHCPGDHKGWVSSKPQQLQTFINQADFGFVKQQLQSKTVLCKPRLDVSFVVIRYHHFLMSVCLHDFSFIG